MGDMCGIPLGKTGGSARHHGPVVVGNLVAAMEGKKLKEKFDKYVIDLTMLKLVTFDISDIINYKYKIRRFAYGY